MLRFPPKRSQNTGLLDLPRRHPAARIAVTCLLAATFYGASPARGQSDDVQRDAFLSKVDPATRVAALEESYNGYAGQYTLRIPAVDLPGKGGLDLVVRPYYSSEIWNRADTLVNDHVVSIDTADHLGGNGWQLHMGKIFDPHGTSGKPTLVMPDGSARTLWSSSQFAGEFISEDRWRLRFDGGLQRWFLTATDGTVYEFSAQIGPGTQSLRGETIAQCTKITDVNGNVITIQYADPGKITSITDSYGRTVEFTYLSGGDRIQFMRVKNGSTELQEWEFRYSSSSVWTESHPQGPRSVYNLTEIIPPEGASWLFTYFSSSTSIASGRLLLQKLTLPTGGTVSYTYDDEIFDVGCQSSTVARVTLESRTTAGRDVSSGTWTYSYSLPGKDGMTTTITGPSGSGYTETHVFEGYGPYTGSDVTLWSIGRPRSRAVSNGLQTVTETFDWVEGDVLSSDFRFTSNWLSCGSNRSDAQIRFVRPDGVERTVNRSGKTWVTTQSNFDAYGQPQTITENGDLFRTTTLTYFYDTGLNILDGRVERRTPSPGEITENEYDSSGRVVREELNPAASSPDDVETIYAYDSAGNLTSRTVNNGSLDRLTEYPSGNYSFGLPEVERIYKDTGSFTIDRNATPLGLVDWEEDGRGGSTYRTNFAYDKLGRTTLVDPPLGHWTTISFTSDSSVATVNRGQYITKYSFDGFGRLRKWEDTETGNRREISYDSMGRKTQEAYFVGGLTADRHFFDRLGRRTQVQHPDGSSVFYDYSGEDVTVVDELGRSTDLDYSAFGDPDDRRLERVIDADFEVWD